MKMVILFIRCHLMLRNILCNSIVQQGLLTNWADEIAILADEVSQSNSHYDGRNLPKKWKQLKQVDLS